MSVEPATARALWHVLEPIHAVTYFADECIDAYKTLGLEGFWMGYFAGRAAPMGEVTPAVIEATFFNFQPAMVRRAVPDAWDDARPIDVLDVRAAAAADALRRRVPDIASAAERLTPRLQRVVAAGAAAGRPLFTANRDVAPPSDPVAALWQATTTLREHRGDGHVAVLTAEGLDGCAAHVLFAQVHDVPADLYLRSRGWSAEDWAEAATRLRASGAGPDLHARIEARTDALAAAPYDALTGPEIDDVLEVAGAVADTISASGLYPYPNPIGLPPRL